MSSGFSLLSLSILSPKFNSSTLSFILSLALNSSALNVLKEFIINPFNYSISGSLKTKKTKGKKKKIKKKRILEF
jgi:hypothetical protein